MLYLALEDDYRLFPERLYRTFGTEGAENLYFSVSAGHLESGLDGQMQSFMNDRPDTRLKAFADQYEICLLLVHHKGRVRADKAEETLIEPKLLVSNRL